MTLRRLHVLIRALPHDAPLWAALQAEEQAAQKASPEKIRSRQREWQERNDRAKEASGE